MVEDDVWNDLNTGCYDFDGNPISLKELMLLKHERNRCTVGSDDARGMRVVSMFLGDAFDDDFLSVKPDRPRIYGTAVFPIPANPDDGIDLVAEIRSTTADQARERQRLLVQGILGGLLDETLRTMEKDRVQ